MPGPLTPPSPRVLHIGQRKTGTTWLQKAAEQAALQDAIRFEHRRIAHFAPGQARSGLPDEAVVTLAEGMTALRDLPLYQPFLPLYGLTPAKAKVAE